ncbi:acetylglucosaminyl-phosphatidylinositol de-N-acetylase [Seminavis robusta]|uniref:N-acetylglucosaminylphosphatidylinositol deacetylase n=1 Tax=Seminavis robusta TaxID=568900 RepID=A0A9N8DTU2_9STRA|nr:acetylglucosaminyl-phosphatidylinositol de-N-acetylase [Seminavis robusta]|eukprot:Sro274_g105440.1 acetylglucosaminyl-phosphatidylinositol de-N-acetylase (344) ;mRNA; f:40954-41985
MTKTAEQDDENNGVVRSTKCFVISVQDFPPPDSKQTTAKKPLTDHSSASVASSSSSPSVVHVLVIAHPDDESMFFLPTLTNLIAAGETVWLLCLTTGNYDGLGDTRKKELSNVCRYLGIHRLIQVQVERLKDHPTCAWELDAVTGEIERALLAAVKKHSDKNNNNNNPPIQRLVLITFDFFGVSGHINHRDTYLGVRNLYYQEQKQPQKHDEKTGTTKTDAPKEMPLRLPPLDAWQLETVHWLPIKYMPVAAWIRLLLYLIGLWKPTFTPFPTLPPQNTENDKQAATTNDKHNIQQMAHVFQSVDCIQSWKAMSTHQSQWVWYRRLFVIFSCYTFVNKLKPIR